jgi:hypothetical protein
MTVLSVPTGCYWWLLLLLLLHHASLQLLALSTAGVPYSLPVVGCGLPGGPPQGEHLRGA